MLDDDFLSNKCMDRVATIAMATKSCLIVILAVAFIEMELIYRTAGSRRSFSDFWIAKYPP